MNKRLKTSIPEEFLLNMGTHNVTIHDVKVTAHVADSQAAVDNYITSFRDHLQSTTKVVGIDIKKLSPYGTTYATTSALILCVFGRCLIIHLDCVSENGKVVASLDSLLSDPEICFVGIKELPYNIDCFKETRRLYKGVEAGELAARVLKDPALVESWLGCLVQKVGVPYYGTFDNLTDIEVCSCNPMVLYDDEVIDVASGAYAFFQIGFKLLNSLPSSDTKPKPKV